MENIPESRTHTADLMVSALEESESASLRQYLIDIGKEPLLDEEEVSILAHMIQDGYAARELIAEDTPTDEEKRDLEAICDLGDQAWERLVKSNLRLVVHIAKEYRSARVPFLDRIQDGNLGLFRAAERFDPTIKKPFAAYASSWIRGQISRGLIEKNRIIRFPEYAHYDQLEILQAEKEILDDTGIRPSSEVLAERVDMPLDQVVPLRLVRDPISLEALLEQAPYLEGAMVEMAHDDDDQLLPELSPEKIEAFMANITKSQKEIFRRLLSGMTIDEVALDLGRQKNSVERAIARARQRVDNRLFPESPSDV